MTDAPLPAVLQFWFRNEKQIPGYLLNIPPRSPKSNPQIMPGEEIIPRTPETCCDISDLHDQFVSSGLVLTHASRIKYTRNGEGYFNRFFGVRFHYFPAYVAFVHEDVDEEKLVASLNEITTMGFWQVEVHQNNGDPTPWLSVHCSARRQRYLAEDLQHPVLARKRAEDLEKIGDPSPIAADHMLQFWGGNWFALV